MARVKRPGRSLPGRLRIVAGKWRGRRLPVTDAPGLRPTSERIRETVFNWLSPMTEGARCLDLFAGTGALGIEALSRGAAHVVFVDKNAAVAAAIRKNLQALGATNAEVLQENAFSFLDEAESQPFDIVFLDPPFELNILPDLCQKLLDKGWLSKRALVYLEQGKEQKPPSLPDGWAPSHEKVAGKVSYSLVTTRTQP